MSYGGFPAYVSAAEKQAKARKKQQTYLKKHPNAQPITLTGSKIAHSLAESSIFFFPFMTRCVFGKS